MTMGARAIAAAEAIASVEAERQLFATTLVRIVNLTEEPANLDAIVERVHALAITTLDVAAGPTP